MKFYLKILFFIYSFFSSAVVLADEISLKTQILKLDTKDFEKKISIIEEISFNKSEFALSALKGILSGRIFIRKSDKSILLVDIKNRKYFARNFFDDTELGVLNKRKLKKIKINNNLRNILSNKISIIELTRGNKKEKIEAILNIIKDGNAETLEIINSALNQEKDNEIVKYFTIAKNTIISRYGTDEEKLKALKSLSGNTNNDVVNILRKISVDKSQ